MIMSVARYIYSRVGKVKSNAHTHTHTQLGETLKDYLVSEAPACLLAKTKTLCQTQFSRK